MREYRRDFGYLPQIFGEGDRHKSEVSDIVAEKLNIGSGKQYEKEKYIVDNKSSLSPEDFADWDEGKAVYKMKIRF